jgi:tetratricopeptide (TPR) repeat protein
MRFFIAVSLFFSFLLQGTFSHSQTVSDTLNIAKQLRAKGKIHKSFSLLKKTYANHPNDLNVAWLTAQTAFWANRIGKSKHLYEKAIKSNPKNLYLQLDYAKILVNCDEFEKAGHLLKVYLAYDSTNSQALTALAKIFFWRCRYQDASLLVTKSLKQDPKYQDAFSLYKEIALARSPYLKFGAGYGTDDQPMQTVSIMLGGGLYFNALSALRFTFQAPFMIRDGKTANAFIFQAGNTSFISKANLTINVDAGVMRFPYKSSYTWTGNLSIDKIFLRHLVLSVSAQKIPYFATRTSVDTIVIQNHLAGSVGWNDQNSWNGQAAVEASTYPMDHDLTYTGYAWVFVPPVKFSVFQFRFGYGYNYSNSKKNRFVSEKSLSEIISNYDANTKIAGIYNPYYTPNDQQIHSFLLAITGHLLKWMDFSINANAGFYATTQAPYLYLDKDETNNTILKTGFATTRFYPLTVHLQVLMKVSEQIHLQVEYTYMSTYFYTSHYAGIGLNIRFPNEKKT